MFGEIRSLLKLDPSPGTWEDLCQVVSQLSFEQVEEAMPYIISHLQHWPDQLRVAPLRWRDGLVRGATLPFAPMIRALDAHGMNLRGEDMLTFARSNVVPQLRILSLRGNPVGQRGLKFLVEQGALDRLEALSLSDTYIGSNGVELLAEHMELGRLDRLRQLRVSGTKTSTRSLGRLLDQNKGVLRAVDFSNNELSNMQFRNLLTYDSITTIDALDLSGNDLTGMAFLVLRQRKRHTHFRSLWLQGLELRDASVDVLTQATPWEKLEQLHLDQNMIGPLLDPLIQGSKRGKFPKLHTLGLAKTGVQEQMLVAMLKEMEGLEHVVVDRQLCELEEVRGVAQEHGVILDLVPPPYWLVS